MKRFFFAILIFLLLPVSAGAEMGSANYKIEADVIGSFGNQSSSANYGLGDTGGEMGTGNLESANYKLFSGFWQADNTSISIACTDSLNMGSISGTGQSNLSTNSATCNVITNNSGGYNLQWKASTEGMVSGSDAITAYTPATAGTPEIWSVANTDSEWGGHLGKDSTTVDTGTWGTADTYAGGKWMNIGISDFEIARRTSATSGGGDDEIIWFGAEIGTQKIQPTGTYTGQVTVTATTL